MKKLLCALIGAVCMLCLSGCAKEAPVSLTAFLADGEKTADPAAAVELRVMVNRCEYGEPTQVIRDEAIVRQAAEALSAIEVTGRHDEIASTETYVTFGLYDADGAYLFGAGFQKGLLMADDGRYDVTGLDALMEIDGILLEDDWDAYWEADGQAEAEYLRALEPEFPASIFTLRGLASSRIRVEDITAIEIYVSGNEDAGRLHTADPDLIRRVFEAMQGVQAIGTAPEDGDGETYYVTLLYREPEGMCDRTVWFRFEGDRMECGEATYRLDGLTGLFDVEGADVLEYLGEHYMD